MGILLRGLLGIFGILCQNDFLVSADPINGTLDTPIRVVHCPFNISVNLAANISFIELTYSTLTSAKPLFSKIKATCFVRVPFRFSPVDYVSTKQLEYEGTFQEKDGSGEIETKVAWAEAVSQGSGSSGPVRFSSVQVSHTASRVVAKNPTTVLGLPCTYEAPSAVWLNVHTTFNPSTSGFGTNGVLVQRLRLRWHGTCDVTFPMCDILDNTGQPHLNCANTTWTG
ncbi:hypothetical protein BCR34DRAFT_636882 [Clohesyomyces aquaticus]|uniref:Ubiquitin 3 binding protein But2 C-terminal domain-containing protein n=1 Tax=Clohesyomyces aquaticus TaxID=1231657 RepID=A0A1Y1YUG8_9PLEO|nr:hypothetical protein BCR34DRAFT_636882 [Clohesyomyces aquaticus]